MSHRWIPALLLTLALGLPGCGAAPQASQPPSPQPPSPQPPAPPAPASVLQSKLTATLTSAQGKKAQVYLFAPDEQVRVEEAPSCMAQRGDTLRSGQYRFYVLPEGAKAPVKQEVAPFKNERLQFNDSRPQYLTVLPGEKGKYPDLLLVHQYGSCNGTGAGALALSPDGQKLVEYRFASPKGTYSTIGIGMTGLERLGPGAFRTTMYNNAQGIYTITTWAVREEKALIEATQVEEKRP